MEVTAISIGKSVLSGALNYAQSAVAKEVSLQLGVQRDHSFIRAELEMMQSFLMAAHDERDDNKVVKTWVKQVCDVSYSVEDCLLDFAVRLERQSWWCLSRKVLARRYVANQMKDLRAEVEEVRQRNQRYHLIKGSSSKSTSAIGQPIISGATMSAANEARLPRQKAKMDLLMLIDCKDVALRVIALWGTSSTDLGEMSIMKSIYEDPMIHKNFDCYAWITLMCPFNQTDFIQSIIRQIYVNSLQETGEEGKSAIGAQVLKMMVTLKEDGLAHEFKRYLNFKSYLIVLNGISTIEEWDCIKTCFPNNKKGSRIIVSTEQIEVVSLCIGAEDEALMHKKLLADQSLYAFYKKVFKEIVNLDEQYPELVEQAKLILKKCRGLPLALVTIGGFLANQPKTAVEWRKMNDHISAELEMNPELEIIKAILMKSYDGLPYYLKACFLYLAIFPEDQQIARRRLVRRWIAEGYSSKVRGKSVEEVLDSYFMELISRSMILPSQQSIHSRKGIDSCHVHDLIREIAISKSMEENLVFTLEEGCSLNNQGIVRHLAVSSNWKGDQCEFENLVDLSRIRSLTVFGNWRPFYISDKMRLLRVLDLEGQWDLVDHHLEHIGKLVHLRYLSLRGHYNIFHLPNSLGNLRQLQTLDISGTSIMKLPRTIIKIEKMQRILASGVGQYHFDIYQRANKWSLKSLPLYSVRCCVACCAPNRLGRQFKLNDGALNRRDVCTAFCCSILPYYVAGGRNPGTVEVPSGIWKLKTLHTLGTVDISVGRTVLQDIKRLTRLRKLGLAGINKRNSQELCSAIACLNSLESLSLQSHGETGLSGCLDGMSSPPENLQSLKLYGNLDKLPEWIQGLKNLVKLKLEWLSISEHDVAMQVLGNLPNLATLRLLGCSFSGEEVRFSLCGDAFPTLKVLELNCVRNLKSVEFEEGAAPKLELLQYSKLSSDSVRLFCGLPLLPSLKEFMLDWRDWHDTELGEYLRGQLAENENRPVLKMWDPKS
ncbi:disease resistance protein Pik-2 isoform X2 [Triticum aestivum]|uniref:disease resistance protein Pik-2 isoform X2 n=1 Tax=Triticum aestivum TaxID=4565 RepID=UPI001D01AA4D|nr:disease resistance protein Pik-2-like isoform X2 [Triticum aestivum]